MKISKQWKNLILSERPYSVFTCRSVQLNDDIYEILQRGKTTKSTRELYFGIYPQNL